MKRVHSLLAVLGFSIILFAGVNPPSGATLQEFVSSWVGTATSTLDMAANLITNATRIELDEVAKPSANANHVQVYAKSDADLYYQGDTGEFRVAQFAPFITGTTLSSSETTCTIDWSAHDRNQTLDLDAANAALTVTLANPVSGEGYLLKIVQGSTPTAVTFSPDPLWAGGTGPTITVTNNAVDVINLIYDGTNYIGTYVQDLQ